MSAARRAPALLALALFATACARLPLAPVDPLSADEHDALGLRFYLEGAYEAAAREFAAALTRDPARADVLVHLGDARLALDALDEAITAYEQARARRPDDAPVANNLAWALLQHPRRWPEAEPIIRGALARSPEPRGYYLDTLGVLLLRQDRPRAALEAFRGALADRAVRDRATRRLMLRHAGEALSRLGDAAAAARCERLAAAAEEAAPGAEVGAGEAVC